jgi:hypothetical protein
MRGVPGNRHETASLIDDFSGKESSLVAALR